MVVAVGGTSVNSGRNVSFVAAVVVVDVEVDFLFDFPKKKAIVDFLAVVDAVVVVLRDDMIEVGNLRSLVLDVVDGVGRSRVVASSSSARLPSCSRGCWVVVSSFRKYIYVQGVPQKMRISVQQALGGIRSELKTKDIFVKNS